MTRDDVMRMAREAGLLVNPLLENYAVLVDGFPVEVERFAALVTAAERQKHQESEMMAECMDMVRQDLIAAGLVDKSVPPMMLPEAILSAHRAAVAAEREACANVAELESKVDGMDNHCCVPLAKGIAEAIRDRSHP